MVYNVIKMNTNIPILTDFPALLQMYQQGT